MESINLAPIHGTILSIFLGAIFVYIITLSLKIIEIKNRIFRTTHKINKIKLNNSITSGDMPDTSKENIRKKVVDELMSLIMGTGVIKQMNDSEKGEQICRHVSAISCFYPFPQIVKLKDGKIIKPSKPIGNKIDKPGLVEKWIIDVDEIHKIITWLFSVHRSKLNKLIIAYENSEYKKRQESRFKDIPIDDDLNQTYESTKNWPSRVISEFSVALDKLKSIAEDLEFDLKEYNDTKNTLPNKFWLIFTFAYAFLSFIGSVILPILVPCLNPIFWIYIPISFYIYSWIIILIMVFRI